MEQKKLESGNLNKKKTLKTTILNYLTLNGNKHKAEKILKLSFKKINKFEKKNVMYLVKKAFINICPLVNIRVRKIRKKKKN